MKCYRIIIIFFFYSLLFCIIPIIGDTILYSKTKNRLSAQNIFDFIYKEVTLEGFESLNTEDLLIRTSAKQKPSIKWFDHFPAPLTHSKRYLGIHTLNSGYENILVYFKDPLKIYEYCKEIHVWIFGFFNSGKLYIKLEDTKGKFKVLYLGAMKFRGWKKLTLKLPLNVYQKDLSLKENTPLKIHGFIYDPGQTKRLRINQTFFMDDISITKRPRYLLYK